MINSRDATLEPQGSKDKLYETKDEEEDKKEEREEKKALNRKIQEEQWAAMREGVKEMAKIIQNIINEC